jgi:hypothetical protein
MSKREAKDQAVSVKHKRTKKKYSYSVVQKHFFSVVRSPLQGKHEHIVIFVAEDPVGFFNVVASKKLKERKDMLVSSWTHEKTGLILTPVFDLNRQRSLSTRKPSGQFRINLDSKRHPGTMVTSINSGIVFEMTFKSGSKFTVNDVRFEFTNGLSLNFDDPVSMPTLDPILKAIEIIHPIVELDDMLKALD